MLPGNPLAVAVEVQRGLLEGSRRTAEASLDVQQALGRSVTESIEAQRAFQRRVLGLQYAMLRRATRRTDEEAPGPTVTGDLLRTIDHRVADLHANQEEAFDALVAAVEEPADTIEAATDDSVELLDEQVAAVLATLDTLEAQFEAVDPAEDGHV